MTDATGATRSYQDPCGIARALDRVGERWALLVVRELMLGAKRFTDLRAGLPNASPNVLSQRLRELEAAGVVTWRTLPPPAAATVYELTDWGRELEPVLLALGRWGSRATPIPAGDLSLDALLMALKTTFDPSAAEGLKAIVELRLGAERVRLAVAKKRLDLTRGESPEADAVLTTDAATLRALAFGRRALGPAMRAGDAHVDGDAAVVERALSVFPR